MMPCKLQLNRQSQLMRQVLSTPLLLLMNQQNQMKFQLALIRLFWMGHTSTALQV